MKLADFDFDLPEDMIATRPVKPRSASRLLVAEDRRICDLHVFDLPDLLRAGDRLVLNDTKVIPARLFGVRRRLGAEGETEAKIEVTLLDPRGDGTWRALVKPLKKVKESEEIHFSSGLSAVLKAKDEGAAHLEFNLTGQDFDDALAVAGAMPLPPYIAAKRAADEQDKSDYQTVFARQKGAVAAPTASLHFDEALLRKISRKGVSITYVTLHVGAGTFLPVKVDDVRDHKMHSEWGEVSQKAADEINETRAQGGRIIPVGTTALRLIESAASPDGQMQARRGNTDIFITPGYSFRAADALMTNFHLPKSTLMMLVSALMGVEEIREIYAHAISKEYRFFSYGDASFLVPESKRRL